MSKVLFQIFTFEYGSTKFLKKMINENYHVLIRVRSFHNVLVSQTTKLCVEHRNLKLCLYTL